MTTQVKLPSFWSLEAAVRCTKMELPFEIVIRKSQNPSKVVTPFCLYFRWSFFTLELVAVVFGAARLFLSLAALTVMISSAILWNKYR